MEPTATPPTPPTEPTPVEPVTPAPETPTPATPAPVETPIVPQPVAPVTPPNPFGAALSDPAVVPAAPGVVTSPAKKSPKKLIILLASIVGGLIVLAGIAVLVFFIFFYVSKSDYQAALDQVDTIVTTSSSISGDLSTLSTDVGSATDTVYNNDSDTAQTDLTKLKSEATQLGTLRAMKIGQGATQYATVNKKITASVDYANDMLTSVKTMRPALKICNSAQDSSSVDTELADLNSCTSALDSIGTLPNADLQQYLTASRTNIKQIVSLVTQINALSIDQVDQYDTLTDQLTTAENNLDNAESDYTSNLQKHQNAIDPSDAINSLSTFLTKQL